MSISWFDLAEVLPQLIEVPGKPKYTFINNMQNYNPWDYSAGIIFLSVKHRSKFYETAAICPVVR